MNLPSQGGDAMVWNAETEFEAAGRAGWEYDINRPTIL